MPKMFFMQTRAPNMEKNCKFANVYLVH